MKEPEQLNPGDVILLQIDDAGHPNHSRAIWANVLSNSNHRKSIAVEYVARIKFNNLNTHFEIITYSELDERRFAYIGKRNKWPLRILRKVKLL